MNQKSYKKLFSGPRRLAKEEGQIRMNLSTHTGRIWPLVPSQSNLIFDSCRLFSAVPCFPVSSLV